MSWTIFNVDSQHNAMLILWFYQFIARHGDGLYDSYMRNDHVVNQDADVNGQSPSGLPPLPKHTVSSHFLFPRWCP